jgi:hypothetical protein
VSRCKCGHAKADHAGKSKTGARINPGGCWCYCASYRPAQAVTADEKVAPQ